MWLVCDYLPKAFLANLTALTLGPVVLYHAVERRGCEVARLGGSWWIKLSLSLLILAQRLRSLLDGSKLNRLWDGMAQLLSLVGEVGNRVLFCFLFVFKVFDLWLSNAYQHRIDTLWIYNRYTTYLYYTIHALGNLGNNGLWLWHCEQCLVLTSSSLKAFCFMSLNR